MPGWQDVLQDIAGGASGIVSGLTKGADPFLAWDKVQAADLANTSADLGNQQKQLTLDDLRKMQLALDNPDLNYYGNAAAAKDTANRKTTAAGNLDIFGNQRQLDLQTYLSDPNGAFQQGLKETGWEPGSAEYRQWLAEAISQFNPEGAVKSYDTFGVEKIENRNLNEQAALQFIQAYAQQKDPNAIVTRKPDGTVVIMSNGEEHPIQGDVITKLAAMISDKTPADAISKGVKDETAIQKNNIDFYKAMQLGIITPAQGLRAIEQQAVNARQDYTRAAAEIASIQKAPDFASLDPAEQEARLAEPRARAEAARKKKDALDRIYQQVAASGRLPGVQPPDSGTPRVVPQGSSALTTRPPPGAFAARAAAQNARPDAAAAPWGASSEGPFYPTPGGANNPRYQTPQGASGKISSADQVMQLIQQLYGMA